MAVSIQRYPCFRLAGADITTWDYGAIDGLAVLIFQILAAVQYSWQNLFDTIAAVHLVELVEVALNHLQQIYHIAWPIVKFAFLFVVIVGDATYEVYQITFVRLIAVCQLASNGTKDAVLVGGIAEDGALVLR